MALHDAVELMEYWSQYPPAHVLLRGYVRYNPPPRQSEIDSMLAFRKELGPIGAGRAKKVSEAPAHLQAIMKMMRDAQDKKAGRA